MSLLQQLSGKLRRLQWTGLNSFNYHYILISHFCAVESIFEHDSRGSSTQLKWLVRTQQGNRSALFPCFVVSFSQKRSKKWELVRAKKIPQCCDTLSLANDVASGLLGIKGTVMPCCCPVSWYRLWLVSAQPSSGRGHFIVSRDTGYIISWKKGVCELSFWQLFFFSISRALAFFTYGVRKVTCPVFALPAVRILAIFWVCPSLLNCFLNSAEWKMLECVRIAFKDLLNRKLDWRRNSEHGGSVSFEPAF